MRLIRALRVLSLTAAMIRLLPGAFLLGQSDAGYAAWLRLVLMFREAALDIVPASCVWNDAKVRRLFHACWITVYHADQFKVPSIAEAFAELDYLPDI